MTAAGEQTVISRPLQQEHSPHIDTKYWEKQGDNNCDIFFFFMLKAIPCNASCQKCTLIFLKLYFKVIDTEIYEMFVFECIS